MNSIDRHAAARPIAAYAAFALAALVAGGVAVGHPYIADLLSIHRWQRLRLLDFPARGVLLAVAAVAAATLLLYWARKAADARTVLVVLMAVGMQTTGLRLGANLITVLPLIAIFYVLGEALMRPAMPLPMSSVTFFAVLLLLLDVPYFGDINIYGPARFAINFLSALKAFAVAVAMILIIEREDHLKAAVRWLVIVGIASAVIGVVQILLYKFAHISFSLVGKEENSMKATFLGPMLRASGLTTWAQHLADFLVLVVPFALFRFADAESGWRRLGWLLVLAILIAAIVFTFTYASYFAIAAILAIFPLVRWPRFSLHYVIAIVAIATAAYALGGVKWAMDKYEKKVAQSSGMVERSVYLHATLDQLARDPWLGSGFYADEEFSGNYYRKRVHNTLLQAWADLGLAGLLAFVAMLLINYTRLWRAAVSEHDPPWRTLFQALTLGMTGTMVSMMGEPNLTAPHTWFMLGLVAAALRIWSMRSPAAAPA